MGQLLVWTEAAVNLIWVKPKFVVLQNGELESHFADMLLTMKIYSFIEALTGGHVSEILALVSDKL